MGTVEQGPDGNYYKRVGNTWVPTTAPRQDQGVSLGSVGEAALSIGSSIAGEVGGGLAGIWEAAADGPDRMGRGAAEVERVREAMQYQPSDPAALQAMGNALQPAMEMGDQYLNTVEEGFFGDSPLGAFMRPALQGAAELTGLGAVGRAGKTVARRGRMAERVADSIDTPQAGQRQLQGFLTPDDARAMELPLTPGDEMALLATPETMGKAAARRGREELRRSDPVFGRQVEDVRSAQKDWATGRVKARLGIEGGQNLTDDVLGTKLNELGAEFDRFADDIGNVALTDDVVMQIDDIAEAATGTHGGQIQKLVDDAKKMAAQNNGAITGSDWQILRTRLGKMMQAGSRQGDVAKIGDAMELQEVLTELLESGLPQSSRDAMQATRSQYGLVKGLMKRRGNLSADGRVNANSLHGTLKSANKIRNRADNDLLKELETVRYLEQRITPDSGTAGRLLFNKAAANPSRTIMEAAKKTALYGGLPAAGVGVMNQLSD